MSRWFRVEVLGLGTLEGEVLLLMQRSAPCLARGIALTHRSEVLL